MTNQMPSASQRLARFSIAFAALVLGACNETATIEYTQIGACDAGVHRAFVFFRIDKLSNGATGRAFEFYPGALTLEDGMIEKSPWPHFERGATEMMVGWQAIATRLTVPPRSQKLPNSYLVFRRQTNDPDGSKQANQTAYFLSYDTRAGRDPPIFVTKRNASQTSWSDTSECGNIRVAPPTCNGCHTNDPVKLEASLRAQPAEQTP